MAAAIDHGPSVMDLFVPQYSILDEVVLALKDELNIYFNPHHTIVNWVNDYPDFSITPWHLANSDFSGPNTSFVDVGHQTYVDNKSTEKIYDVRQIITDCSDGTDTFIFGNGIAQRPFILREGFGDLVLNATYSRQKITDDEIIRTIINKSSVNTLDTKKHGKCRVEYLFDPKPPKCVMKGSFFLSNVEPKENNCLLKIYVKEEKKSFPGFINVLQEGLSKKFNYLERPMVMGGVFITKNFEHWRHSANQRESYEGTPPKQLQPRYCHVDPSEVKVCTFNNGDESNYYTFQYAPEIIMLNSLWSTHTLHHTIEAEKSSEIQPADGGFIFEGYFNFARKLYRYTN